jgi:hypothetical protein
MTDTLEVRRVITSTYGTFGRTAFVFVALRSEVIVATLNTTRTVTAKPSSMAIVLEIVVLRWAPVDFVWIFDFNQSIEKK